MNYVERSKTSDYLFNGLLIVIAGAIVVGLILIKKYTFIEFIMDPIVYFYAIFISLFRISRIIGATMHKYSYDRLTEPYITDDYEPSISFVVPCKNEEQSIGMTVDKCFQIDYPREKMEVIVINDGSTDGTQDILDGLKEKFGESLRVVKWTVNRGKRHGMAEGFRIAKGEIVVQLDSDSYVNPATFRNLIMPFANPAIGGISAHTDPSNADKNWITKMQAAYYFVSFKIQKAAESTFQLVFCLSGCCSAYRKSIVLPVLDQFLQEKFLGLPITWGDDRSLTNWVMRQGYITLYTDRVQAFTICPEDMRTFFKQQVRWKKGWFVNSVLISKFVFSKAPFVAITYFFPLFFISLSVPFVALINLVYYPAFHRTVPLVYIIGIMLITGITICYYRYVSRDHKYWPYLFLWSIINMALLSFILFYSLATIQNRKWGTR